MAFLPNEYTVVDGIAHVLVTHRKKPPSTVLIDIDDWSEIRLLGRVCISGSYPYIQVNRKPMRIHVLVMKPDSGAEVDHKFGNGMDNRRSELLLSRRLTF